ncbi:MAG: type II secretion system F family protein [Candidatus Aenigmarchaeota archaeon]|nr:type II secretion system F family protein [Candidatus Aenigmarchaeota archaeon]
MSYKTLGKKLIGFFPGLEVNLKHAEIKLAPEMYLGRLVMASTFFSTLMLAIMTVIYVIFRNPGLLMFLIIIPLAGFGITFFYGMSYPRLIISKRTANLEKNLLFALRHLLVEIRSGISLYEALLSVGRSNYGALSEEFKKMTKMISMGVPENKAMEEVMIKNPSTNFRRAMWQITNSMQAGYDVGDTIEELVKEFSMEQRTAIRMYGAQLNSLALVYMIFAIILPSIGVCFLIILSFFSKFPVSQGILMLLMAVVTIFQFMFIGIIKSKRPKVE